MRCTGFLKGCYSGGDLNVGTNNGAWAPYNGQTSSTTGHSYNVFLPPLTTGPFVLSDIEMVRQTMMKQDMIFRDQVRESHRLYSRQKELMDEYKTRELSKQKLQLQAPHSSSFLSEITSNSAQCTWQTPGLAWLHLAANTLSTSSSENIQSISSKWKSKEAGPCTAQDDDSLKEDLKLLGPNSENPRRKMLDLELPADEYIDSEEEDQLGEGKLSKVPELPYYPPETMPGILKNKGLKLFPSHVNSSSQGGLSAPDSFSASTNNLGDWNGSVRCVNAFASNSVNLSGCGAGQKEIQCQDQQLPRKSNLGFQFLSKEIVSSVQSKTSLEVCINSACSSRTITGPDVGVYPVGTSFCSGSQSESRKDACFPLIGSNHLNRCSSIGSSGRSLNSVTMDLNIRPICLLGSEVCPQNFGTENGKLEESQVEFQGGNEKIDPSNKHNEGREDSSQADLVFSQVFPIPACDIEPKMCTAAGYAVDENILGLSSNHEKPCVFPTQAVAFESAPNDSHPCASEDKGIESNQKTDVLQAKLADHPYTNNMSLVAIVDGNLSMDGKKIDLKLSIQEEKSSPKVAIPSLTAKSVAVIDLEAPVSPENKECSPPRGESRESGENQVETPIELSKQDDRISEDELVRKAAESLALIATTRFQTPSTENNVCEALEVSLADSLQWLAGVISSAEGGLGSDVGMVLSSEDASYLSSDGSDYFEAMAVELTEMKVKEYWSKNSSQEEEEPAAKTSQRPANRGQMKRLRQQKDFQTAVLPSLASLSRYEVAKDLKTIGWLMEDAGSSPVQTCSGRRYPPRNTRASRAKRQSRNSSRHGAKKAAEFSPLKQENSDGEMALAGRMLESWGKMNKRQRGPRIPASNPALLFV